MEAERLKKEILNKYQILQIKLTDEEKTAFHFKSLSNFIYHVFKNQSPNSQKSKLREVNLFRNMMFISEYLNLILTSEVSVEDSEMLFKEHIGPIGDFMSEYYGFIFAGGKTGFFYVFTNIAIGLVVDIALSFIFNRVIWVFTASLFVLSILRIVLKQRDKKIYGPNY